MLELLNDIDTQLFLALHNAIRCQFLDHFMMLFSCKWTWVGLYISIAALIIHNTRNLAGLLTILAVGLAIVVTDQTCADLVRPLVGRLRPSNPDNPLSALVTIVNNYHGGNYGFPSCHAANSMAFATFISLIIRQKHFSLILFTWALINSFSRVYLGVHYPGDLIVGWIIGGVIALSCYFILNCTTKRHLAQNIKLAPPIRGLMIPLSVAAITLVVIICMSI